MEIVRPYVAKVKQLGFSSFSKIRKLTSGPVERVRTVLGTYATKVVTFYSALFYDLLKLLLQVVIFATFVGIAICINVFLLYCFKWIVMPPAVFSSPVHFDYSTPLPFAYVPFHDDPSYVKTNDTSVPLPRFLPSRQPYSLEMTMLVPESPQNFEVGIFMMSARLLTANDDVIRLHKHPVMVRYRSWILQTTRTVLSLVPLLLGLWEETQTLAITLTGNYIDDWRKPLAAISLEVSNPKVQIYEAHIVLTAQFTGLRYMIYHWWWVFLVVMVWFLLLIEIACFCSLKWFRGPVNNSDDDLSDWDDDSAYKPKQPPAPTTKTFTKLDVSGVSPAGIGSPAKLSLRTVKEEPQDTNTNVIRRRGKSQTKVEDALSKADDVIASLKSSHESPAPSTASQE